MPRRILMVAGLLSTGLFGQETTLPGLFNPTSAKAAGELGAKSVRILVFANFLEQANQAVKAGNPHRHKTFAEYDGMGMKVVGTLFLWAQVGKPLPEVGSPEWQSHVANVKLFLEQNGKHLSWVSLDNEPMLERVDSDFEPDGSGKTRAEKFYGGMAAEIAKIRSQNPTLSRLRIASPAFNTPYSKDEWTESAGVTPKKMERFQVLARWAKGDPNIEGVDVHLHSGTAQTVNDGLSMMKKEVGKPILVLEWSQSYAAHAWLDSPLDGTFASKWNRRETTPRKYISACLKKPVSLEEWNDLISRAPYEKSYLADSFRLGVAQGAVMMCYGAHQQYGANEFDGKQILANLTVVPGADGAPQRNWKFWEWYRDFADRFDKGEFGRKP